MSKILIDEATVKLALETTEGIANANWREWHELASQEEFERWVKSRATHMAAAIRAALAEQPAQQEPVAWGVFEGNLHDMFFTQSEAQEMAKLKGTHAEVRPLYAAPQPAQLPFGVGGGLVAIKTLLSRDPCAHANLAIEMIDAILAEHPTQVDIRNATLEEIAAKIGKMPFGDTAASFAVWIREQKT